MANIEPIDDYVYGNDVLKYADKDILICGYNSLNANGSHDFYGYSSATFETVIHGVTIPHTKRIVGLILSKNIDETLKIAILGDESVSRYDIKQGQIDAYSSEWTKIVDGDIEPFSFLQMNFSPDRDNNGIGGLYFQNFSNQYEELADYNISTNFKSYDYANANAVFDFTRRGENKQPITGSLPTLFFTKDKKDTTITGYPNNTPNNSIYKYTFYNKIYSMFNGNIYEYLQSKVTYLNQICETVKGDNPHYIDITPTQELNATRDLTVLNLILTKNENEALKYLEDGTLPSDAKLLPYDFENPPTMDDDIVDEDTENDENENNENGNPLRDCDATPPTEPSFTPQKLSTNNLYWLSAGQLESFINWFWNDVGEITDITDLLNKVQGLYGNLSQAILNVRYFPVNSKWIGGTETVQKIVVGNVSKDGEVLSIKRDNPKIRTIGSIDIKEYYKSFCDYSPYADLTLYLPFFGFLNLDVNVFMSQKLTIKAIYDVLSGGIQYLIYCNETMFNCVMGKIAVDIPINLQSKSDRDSAIFQNISGVTTDLIGGLLSVQQKNPIGLVNSVSDALNVGTESAPMRAVGNSQESGSFYSPSKCAIYIKRPSYNRPKNYKKEIGYPCNKQYKLKSLKGFTICSNVKIRTFQNHFPTNEEYEEIVQLLEQGVIL